MLLSHGKKSCVATLAATLAGSCGAAAQTPAEFYQGKTVNIIVGFSPGGGYDQYARLLARHMGEHIPGKPTLVVQNAPGAGSLTAVKRIDTNLPTDGTAMVTFNPAKITESLTMPDKVNFNFNDVAWIGSITRDFRVCYAWSATGVKTWDDAVKRNELIFGGTSKGTGSYVNSAILKNVFGINVRHILGFPGSAEQRIAIERGELEADCGSFSSIPDHWIKENKINVFVTFSPVKTPDMPNAPYIATFAKTDEQKKILQMLGAAGDLGRPYIMSKEVPAERLKAMRAAFDTTMKDKDFLAEAAKQGLPVYPETGPEAEKTIKEIYAFPKELIAKAAKAMD